MFTHTEGIYAAAKNFGGDSLQAWADDIAQSAKPALWFTLLDPAGAEGAPTTEPPVGSSYVGGRPDVTVDFVWPTQDEKPLTFLFQVDARPLLPYRLAVFAGEPNEPGGHHVAYFDPEAPTERWDYPANTFLSEWFMDPEFFERYHPVIPHQGLDIPRWSSEAHDQLMDILQARLPEEDDEFEDLYEDFRLMAEPDGEAIIRVGGYHAGIGFDSAADAVDKLGGAVSDWRHLVTLDSTRDMCIGDAGYFQVLRRDLDGATFADTESS